MNNLIVANTNIAGRRPPAGSRRPGELFVNMADGVLGYVNPAGNPIDLTIGAIPGKPSGRAAFLTIDATGKPSWLNFGQGIVATPPAAMNQTIKPSAASDVPLTLQGHASQVADLFQVRNAGNEVRLSVSAGSVTRVTGPAAGMLELRGVGGTMRSLGLDGTSLAVDGPMLVRDQFRITDGSNTRILSLDGAALDVNGHFTATSLFTRGNVTVAGSVHVNATGSAGSAAIFLHDYTGSTRRGLVYAASDGSYVRLLKYHGAGASLSTDVYLNLVASDCRLESASATPLSSVSLMTRQRSDDRYIQPGNNLRANIGALGAGEVGTYGFFDLQGGTHDRGPGTIVAGGDLAWASTSSGDDDISGSRPSGTWRWMSWGDRIGLALRIS